MRSGEQCKLSGVLGKATTEIDFCVIISQKASTRGLTTYDGKNSEEAHFRACLWALKSEET